MLGNAAARPRDLAMLRQVLDEYCRDQELAKAGLMREAVAERIMMLYESGIKDPTAIMAALTVGSADK